MPNSLFDVVCPTCGRDLDLTTPGEGRCRPCGASYLVRIGYLIPKPAQSALHPVGGTKGKGH